MSQITTVMISSNDINDDRFWNLSQQWLKINRTGANGVLYSFNCLDPETDGGDKTRPFDIWIGSFNCFETDDFAGFLNANGINEDSGFEMMIRDDDHGPAPNVWRKIALKEGTWYVGGATMEGDTNHAEKKDQS